MTATHGQTGVRLSGRAADPRPVPSDVSSGTAAGGLHHDAFPKCGSLSQRATKRRSGADASGQGIMIPQTVG